MKMYKRCQNTDCPSCQTNKNFPDEYEYCPFCGNKMNFVPNKKAAEISETQIIAQISSREKEAEDILNDYEKFQHLLQRLARKLKHVPVVGTALSDIPLLISLVTAYVHKEYTEIPLGSIIAATCALIYFVSPVDLIPDAIPGLGLTDDAVVLAWVLKMIKDDVDEYKQWMYDNGKEVE